MFKVYGELKPFPFPYSEHCFSVEPTKQLGQITIAAQQDKSLRWNWTLSLCAIG